MYRTVADDTWSDTWFAERSPLGKLVFLYLFTNTRINAAGVYEIGLRQIAFDTGLSATEVTALLQGELAGKVTWWPDLQIVWVRNFFKRQRANASDTFTAGARKALITYPVEVRRLVIAHYPALADPDHPLPPPQGSADEGICPPTLPLPYPYPIDTVGVKDKGKDKETGEGKETAGEIPSPTAARDVPRPGRANPPPIMAIVPAPKPGFDYPALWDRCRQVCGCEPTWNYAVETKAVKRLLTAYPNADPTAFACFLAFLSTCWPWSEETTRLPTFSEGAKHFAGWMTQGQPTTAPPKGDRPDATPDKLTTKLRSIRAGIEADYAERLDDGSQNGDQGPAYQHVPRLLPRPATDWRGA